MLHLSGENAFLQFITQEFPKAVVETLLDVRKEVESALLKAQDLYVKWVCDSISRDHLSIEILISNESNGVSLLQALRTYINRIHQELPLHQDTFRIYIEDSHFAALIFDCIKVGRQPFFFAIA